MLRRSARLLGNVKSFPNTNVASFATDSLHVKRAADKFYVKINSDEAYLEYRDISSGLIELTHTEVPPEFQGKGVGKILVNAAFDYIEKKGLKAIVVCDYIQSVVDKNPHLQKFVQSE